MELFKSLRGLKPRSSPENVEGSQPSATQPSSASAVHIGGNTEDGSRIFQQCDINQKTIHYHGHPISHLITEDKGLLQELKDMLVSDYVTIQGPTLPWLEECTEIKLDKIFVDLEMLKRDSNDPEEIWKSIQLRDIFVDLVYRKEPIHVLIEGGPGVGKSTLALKMAHDWAKGVKVGVENYMTNFDLVVLFLLRRLDNNSLKTFLADALELCNRSEEEIWTEVEKRNCLFILDGYDELSETQCDVLRPLFEKRAFRKTSLVVLSRPGKTAKFNRRFTRRIIIKGIPKKHQMLFLGQYLAIFDRKETQYLMDKLQTFKFKEDFLNCPLINILVALLARECDVANLITTTDVYKHFLNFMVRRGLSKMGKPDIIINLFQDWGSDETEWPFYVTLMKKFGEFAFTALQNKKTTFDSSEILHFFENSEEILQMDFFTVNQSFRKGLVDSWYEPIHLTFFEFGAAYYLWLSRQEFQEKYLKLEVVGLFSENWIEVPCNRPELVFFGEMLGDVEDILVRALRMCQKEYYRTRWFYNFGFRLNGLPMTNDLLSQLDHFIPQEWEVGQDPSFNTSLLHREILTRENSSGKIIKRIVWDVQYEANIPEEIKLETLILKVYNEVCQTENPASDRIWCQHLECEIYGSFQEFETYRKFAVLLETINFEDISFFFLYPDKSPVWLLLIQEEAITGLSRSRPIRNIRARLESGNIENFLTTVIYLVGKEKVSELELDIESLDSTSDSNTKSVTVQENPPQASNDNWDRMWNSFFTTAGKSSCLTYLKLINGDQTNDIYVDNNLLTNHGGKQWVELYFDGHVKHRKFV